MREYQLILDAFRSLQISGARAALATVVDVNGSSYRRPGARMLVAEDGRTWGGVSGGCLERDVARRARGIIGSGRAMVCRYDTADEQEDSSGPSLGCRGVIDILIEPLPVESMVAGNELPLAIYVLATVVETREPIAIATILKASLLNSVRTAARVALDLKGQVSGGVGDERTDERVLAVLHRDLGAATARVQKLDTDGSEFEVFIETLLPPQPLVIFGSGPDVQPLVEMAKALGWHVTVVGSRPATGFHERFAAADVLRLGSADDPVGDLLLSPRDAVVLMTHNYHRDQRILERLLPHPRRYLGILGPARRTDDLLEAHAAAHGELELGDDAEIYSPVGLDIGAKTPEQIALAILAEVVAVTQGATAGFLRDRRVPIHCSSIVAPDPRSLPRPACPT